MRAVFFFSEDSKITKAIGTGMEEGCGITGKKVRDEVIYNARHPHGFHGEAMYGRVTSTSLLHLTACACVHACVLARV